jgi:uncharacterized RDD family membrane protein YckC
MPPPYQAPITYPAAVPYAGWLNRVGSYLIDAVISGIPSIVAQLFFNGSRRSDGGYSAGRILIATVFWLVSLLIVIYNRWILAGRTGQSWGKRVMKTKLIGVETGQPIGVLKAFLRDICHILDDLCGIFPLGFLWPLWDRMRQTFADKIMRTVVVKV